MKRAAGILMDITAALICGSAFCVAAWWAAGFWTEALK